MKIKKSISQSASLNLRVLVALVVTLAGASLAFFAAASPPTSSGLRHSELPNTFAAAPLGGPPVVVSITPIRGPERAFQPSATIADLDHGFAAGATRPRQTAQRLLPASDHPRREQGRWQRAIPGRANTRSLGRGARRRTQIPAVTTGFGRRQCNRYIERRTTRGGHPGRGVPCSAGSRGRVAGRGVADTANQPDLVGSWKRI